MGKNNEKDEIIINVNDIIGQVFGSYKVNKYVGFRRGKPMGGRKTGAIIHLYEIECVICGSKRISSRNDIIHQFAKRKKCRICNGRDTMMGTDGRMLLLDSESVKLPRQEFMEVWRKGSKPNKGSKTGIKRYNISHNSKTGTYTHRVELNIEGKRYILARIYDKSDELRQDCIDLANEANKAMSKGKDSFLYWYDNVYQKIYK